MQFSIFFRYPIRKEMRFSKDKTLQKNASCLNFNIFGFQKGQQPTLNTSLIKSMIC